MKGEHSAMPDAAVAYYHLPGLFEFYDFYRAKMLAPWAEPNAAHRKLAQWEQEGRLKAVITQNIDGLHQKAGSREVLELHGSVLRNYCERCGAFYGLDTILHSTCLLYTSPSPRDTR